jgi:hypothetical protein
MAFTASLSSTAPRSGGARRTRRIAAALVALFATSACVSYQFTDEELHFRHDAKADTLDLLIVQRGIGAKDGAADDEWKKVVDLFAEFALPDRRLVCCGPTPDTLLSGSLDQASDEDKRKPWFQVSSRLTIPSEGFFLDEHGRLSLWQHLHMKEASVAIAAINEGISLEVLRVQHDEDEQRAAARKAYVAPEDALDDATRALRHVYAATHQPWLEWRDGSLVAVLPTSDVGKRNAIRAFLGEYAKWTKDETHDDAARRGGLLDMSADWMALLDSVTYEHHQLVYRVGRDDRIDFTTHVDGFGYDPRSVERLKQRGIAIDDKLTRDQIVTNFDAARAEGAKK